MSTVSRDGSSASDTGNVDREGDSATPTPSAAATSYAQSYLQNPYYFMFACLAKPDDDTELHWLKVNFYSLLIDIWELIFCRTVAHDVQLVPSFLPFITWKTRNTATKMLAFSSSPILASGRKEVIGWNWACMRSLGTFHWGSLLHLSSYCGSQRRPLMMIMITILDMFALKLLVTMIDDGIFYYVGSTSATVDRYSLLHFMSTQPKSSPG